MYAVNFLKKQTDGWLAPSQAIVEKGVFSWGLYFYWLAPRGHVMEPKVCLYQHRLLPVLPVRLGFHYICGQLNPSNLD